MISLSAMPTAFDFAGTPIDPGLSVIEASAGTGKTHAISHLVPRLLLERTASRLGEILLVTFTNDAARELSDRVRTVLEKLCADPRPDEILSDPGVHQLREKFPGPDERAIIARALLDIDQLAVSTIHSFCQRVVQTEGTLCGQPVIPELIADADGLIKEALYDLWKTRVAGNELASSIAAAQKWDPANDLRFVRQVLGLDDFEAEPPARAFGEVLQELKEGARQFTKEMVGELARLAQKVPHWNKAGGDDSFRNQQFSNLRNDENFSDWIDAVNWLPRMASAQGGMIPARGAANNALIRDAANLPVVLLARKMSGLYARLSWYWQFDCLADIRQTVSATLRKNRQITYDGLITTLRDALRSPEHGRRLAAHLRGQFKVALIDESQDTDPRQFEIFRAIFVGNETNPSDSRLVLIGDPKQAIYAFRGADVNTYLGARAQAEPRVFSLTKTFRSPEPLVRAVNALFQRPGSLLKDGLDCHPATSGVEGDVFLESGGADAGARMEAWIVAEENAADFSNADKRLPLIADTVASEIVRLLKAGARIVHRSGDGTVAKSEPVHPGDFAILVGNRFEAAALMRALQARRVPAIQAKGADIMTSDEASELLVLLRAIEEPRRSSLRRAALATRLLGRNAKALRRLNENPHQDDEVLETFLHWQAVLQRRGIAAALAEMDCTEKTTLRLAGMQQGERRVTNLRQLTDLLQAASLECGNHPGHLVRWFGQEIARAGTRAETDERQQQLESDAQAVKIVTMHAAKGLEYNLVFCPFLWSARVIEKNKGAQTLSRKDRPALLVDPGLAENPSRWARDIARANLEDRLRLAYVAITRAKVKVWIWGGAVAGKATPASALDWLLRTREAPDFDAWCAALETEDRGEAHQSGLSALAAADGGSPIQLLPPPPRSDAIWQPMEGAPSLPLSSLASPEIPKPWVLTSFSALTREKNPHGSGETVAPQAPAAPQSEANSFSSAPGGAMVGTAIHDWIERWDFSSPKTDALIRHLGNYPLPETDRGRPMHECVGGMLEDLRAAILPGLDCGIREACPRPEASEWHFQLPIRKSLSSHSLAQVFAAHGNPDYAALLAALPAEELNGYLHGFLDRLAFRNGVWEVLDWKTNKLLPDYGQDSLLTCAMQSHYLLQAHLYLVALRRYLGPENRIAGACLVFLRGIRAGTAEGILHLQPSDHLMRDLGKLFAPPRK